MEFSGFFLSAFLTIRGCWVITSTRVFNRNLNFILAGTLFQWMESMIGRLMIAPYQKGWIQLAGNDPRKVYSEFFTASKYEMIQIKNSLFDSPIFSIGSILLTHYMVFAILGLTGITVERSLATFWINDYEKKPRNWIPIFVLITLQLTSWLIAYSAIQILLDIYLWLMIGILVLTFNFLLMGYIWYWNVRVHQILDNFKIIPSKYTLQARFQAKENARSLSFLKITVVVISSALIFECVFFILQASNVFRDYEVILYYLVDYDPRSTALHGIIDRFESISIIANGLAIQKEMNSKSLKIDHFLAEILGINPENNGFEELRMFQMGDLSERYARLSNDAGTVKKSGIDESMVKSQLDVFGKMGEDLEILKRGETQNVDEILEKRKNIFGNKTTLLYVMSENFDKFPVALNNTFKLHGNDWLFKGTFRALGDELEQFDYMVDRLMKFEEIFKDLLTIKGLFSQLGPLRTLGKVADIYRSSYANLTKLKDNLEALNKDIPVLIPFIKKSAEIRNLNKDLGKLYGMFEKFYIPNPSTRLLTAALTRGTRDITRLFQDITTQWFQKSITNYNEEILMKMKFGLHGLKMLNEDMAKAETQWDTFKNKVDIINVRKSLDFVEGASKNVIDINLFQNLQSSSSGVAGCLMNLVQITVDVDFNELNQILDQLEDIEKAALVLKPLFVEFSKISVLKNQSMVYSLRSALSEINFNQRPIKLWSEVSELRRSNPEYDNLLEGSLKACELMLRMRKTGIEDLLTDSIKNWDVLRNTTKVLTNTHLIETLECLQQKKFDAIGISKLVTFGSMIRSIGDEYKKDKSVETFIGQMQTFQKHLVLLKSSFDSIKPPNNSIVDSFENGLIVSQDLSKGVDLLRKMEEIYTNKKYIDIVMAGGKEMFQEIHKMIHSEKFESEMKKLLEDIQKLNFNATKDQSPSLLEMREFLEHAITIQGVSIDSKLLADPVALHFKNSTDPNIRKIAFELKWIGRLQLDFSNGRSDFKAAQLSISILQEYFDQIMDTSEIVCSTPNLFFVRIEAKLLWMVVYGLIIVIIIMCGFLHKDRLFGCNKKEKQEVKLDSTEIPEDPNMPRNFT
ncbi:hypothetical protein B9Z55_004555 [Caenorhabditis nigoni]|nr:hypothetical protein B9Z55_004555 [Caenorhabditis nigoni]